MFNHTPHPHDLKDCLQCDGTGKLFFMPKRKNAVSYIDCDICKGTGKAERSDFWEAIGFIIKDWRIGKQMGLREASRKFCIDPSNLSKMERGIIKPNPEYVRMVFDDLKLHRRNRVKMLN